MPHLSLSPNRILLPTSIYPGDLCFSPSLPLSHLRHVDIPQLHPTARFFLVIVPNPSNPGTSGLIKKKNKLLPVPSSFPKACHLFLPSLPPPPSSPAHSSANLSRHAGLPPSSSPTCLVLHSRCFPKLLQLFFTGEHVGFFPDKRNTTPSPQDTEDKLWVSGLEGDLLSQLNLPLGLKGAPKSPSQNVA